MCGAVPVSSHTSVYVAIIASVSQSETGSLSLTYELG